MLIMKRVIIVIIIVAGLFPGCERGDEKVKYSGEIVLTSERILTDTYRSTGFSFEEGKIVPYPPVGGVVPDIVVTNETDLEGNITGANFTSPNNLIAFHLEASFSTLTEALAWYEGYNEVTATDFSALANQLTPYQVWTVQTTTQKYAKLVIKNIEIKTDSPVSDYIAVTYEFQYQPDGSKIFSD